MACSVFQVSCPFAGLAEKKTFMIKVVDSLSEGDKRQKNWPGWKFQFATFGVADVVADVADVADVVVDVVVVVAELL